MTPQAKSYCGVQWHCALQNEQILPTQHIRMQPVCPVWTAGTHQTIKWHTDTKLQQ